MSAAQWVAGTGGGQEMRMQVTGQLKLCSPSTGRTQEPLSHDPPLTRRVYLGF